MVIIERDPERTPVIPTSMDPDGCGRPRAARLAEYSARLWAPAVAVAPAEAGGRLTRLLDAALAEVTDGATRRAALRGWRRWRTLSTGPHVCPTYGPRFLAMDRIYTAGAPPEAVPIVGAWSGIPFNNGARPMHLVFAGPLDRVVAPDSRTARRVRGEGRRRRAVEYRIPLGSGRDRHRLVYGAPVPRALPAVLDDLRPAARALVADPEPGEHSTWALRTVARIQSRVLGRPIVSIDVNRLLTAYLLEVVEDAGHPVGRLFSDRVFRARWCARLPDDPWFVAGALDRRGRPRVETVRCVGDHLVSRSRRWPIAPGTVARLLAERALCPGLVLVYAVLVGVEGVRCLGGERQAVYLVRFASAWRALGLPVPRRPGPIDISGQARDARGAPVFPFDLALDGRRVHEVVPDSTPLAALGLETSPRPIGSGGSP